ncbi:hypothetical protein NE237_013766 [Protea cynaroides]|uniref:Uncharacterized protein n=1 Tax=Protea cynaroides TaxID=273540 RepID=A0A9Q0GZY9_9MAGN|nr:hypothetical protein NE237_013766 [Protea cynaroides]
MICLLIVNDFSASISSRIAHLTIQTLIRLHCNFVFVCLPFVKQFAPLHDPLLWSGNVNPNSMVLWDREVFTQPRDAVDAVGRMQSSVLQNALSGFPLPYSKLGISHLIFTISFSTELQKLKQFEDVKILCGDGGTGGSRSATLRKMEHDMERQPEPQPNPIRFTGES